MIYEILLDTNVDLGYYKCNTCSITLGYNDNKTYGYIQKLVLNYDDIIMETF